MPQILWWKLGRTMECYAQCVNHAELSYLFVQGNLILLLRTPDQRHVMFSLACNEQDTRNISYWKVEVNWVLY